MENLLNTFKDTSPFLIIIAIIIYYLKVYLEKKIDGVAGRIEEIKKTSLEIKKELRDEERAALINFRVAVEEWEYFLQTALMDYSFGDFNNFQVKNLYESDKKLFLDVRISIIKSCVYLRNKELEIQLLAAVLKIRENYYPIINGLLPEIIDIKSKLAFFDNKLAQFQKSGMKDMAFAPTEQDRKEYQSLNEEMTRKMEVFAKLSVEKYKDIAEKLYDLKEMMNGYIYRPISSAEINKD